MKKLIEVFKVFRLIRKNYRILKVVEDIFKFVETTSKEGKPMMCKIALLNTGTGEVITDFVSLWAGIGDASPLERVRQLKAQNDELKRLLQYILNLKPEVVTGERTARD